MNTYEMKVQEQTKDVETGRWCMTGSLLKVNVSAKNDTLAQHLAIRQALSQGMKHPKVVEGPNKLPSQGPMRQTPLQTFQGQTGWER